MSRTDRVPAETPPDPRPAGTTGHSWMMIACCIPMLIIATALVVTGVASTSWLFVALMCTAMMAMMMRGMSNKADP